MNILSLLFSRRMHIQHHDPEDVLFEVVSKEDRQKCFSIINNVVSTNYEAIVEQFENLTNDEYILFDEILKFTWCQYWRELSHNYLKITTSSNFILLSFDNQRRNKLLLKFAEQACDQIYQNLGEVLKGIPGKILIFHLNSNDYYALEQSFGFTNNMSVQSGGMFVRNIIPFMVFHSERGGFLPDSVLAHELTHALLCFNELPMWLDEALACTMEKSITRESYDDWSIEKNLENVSFWNDQTIQTFWSGESFSVHSSQEFSYLLAQGLLNVIITHYPTTFKEFLKHANRSDSGETAAQKYLGTSLNDITEMYMGEGNWKPIKPRSDS